MESGLVVPIYSKKDTDAAPTAFHLEKLTSKVVDELSANLSKRKGTCWTCGNAGHTPPDCPTKNNHSSNTSKNKNNDHTEKSIATLPCTEWQKTKPNTGERDTIVRDSKTWMWCDWCNLWSTTHSTLTQRSLSSSNSESVTPKVPNNDKECQGNLPDIVHYGSILVDTNKLTQESTTPVIPQRMILPRLSGTLVHRKSLDLTPLTFLVDTVNQTCC